MFTNLIESCSHRNEVQRRSYFFLFTTASYALLLTLAGVASIYAYDARVKEPDMQLVTVLSPTDFPEPPEKSPEVKHPSIAKQSSNKQQAFDERQFQMLSVNHPELPPPQISTKPNTSLPIRDGVPTVISDRDIDSSLFTGTAGPNRTSNQQNNPIEIVTNLGMPPPASVAKPQPTILSRGVITGEAVMLPKPGYPEIAKQIRVHGIVAVQILVDETGKVISAQVLSGHPLLSAAAVRAAYAARFRPTLLGDRPVKVSGTITYNFVLQG